jgi:hypothetical protein
MHLFGLTKKTGTLIGQKLKVIEIYQETLSKEVPLVKNRGPEVRNLWSEVRSAHRGSWLENGGGGGGGGG